MSERASVIDWGLALEHQGLIEDTAKFVSRSFRGIIPWSDLAQIGLLYVAEHSEAFFTAQFQDGVSHVEWGIRRELRRVCKAEKDRQSRLVPLSEPDEGWTAE